MSRRLIRIDMAEVGTADDFLAAVATAYLAHGMPTAPADIVGFFSQIDDLIVGEGEDLAVVLTNMDSLRVNNPDLASYLAMHRHESYTQAVRFAGGEYPCAARPDDDPAR